MKKITLFITSLILVLFTIGCSTKGSVQVSQAKKSSRTIYVYYTDSVKQDERKYQVLSQNLFFSLTNQGMKPINITTINEIGKDGFLLTVNAMQTTTSLRRKITVLYTLTENETGKVIRKGKVHSASMFGGYTKILHVIGRSLAGQVVRGT